ncbi:RagB/SusD family nutrient uptake outer membrane protein [Flavobacterium cellulosilyticum]|uniref:RagB/SusD family nutrient uptake outer membrane protein n=1 Tax=Flavobacterium cellulosilyticum TaxID=2541731 RepID=A0A4R5CJB9_9FLAO|nr:RagB/SusD family nutrient uptake outer membrane protein [Flavobacterium cellulosilyticum]TDD98700.1 RagB/SusD family nutrient uptake outer membrane protein [Flavobacterium cellulosilyticum]
MKKITYIILFCNLLLLGCSSDFLDKAPISNANEENFYKSQKDIETAIWSAYNSLYTLYGPESLPSFYGELMSDNAVSDNAAGRIQDYESFELHTMTIDNELVLNFWNNYYKAIYITNNIIASAEKLDFPNRDALIGEAKFLRALYYFDMVRAWGDVPLVTTPISITNAYAQGRTSKTLVYEQIIKDLDVAVAKLPVKTSQRFVGAASQEAANTLLAKVYLTIGNKPKATETLLKVYGRFSLVPYADLWNLSKKNNASSIFEIQFKGGVSNPYSLYWAMFSPVDNRVVTAWGGGYNQITNDLWNAYETGDPRRDLTIQNGYQTPNGSIVNVKFPIKWKDAKAPVIGLREASDNNFIILRYADVLLMLTEATSDPKYMNEVRSRVGLPAYATIGYPAKYNTVSLALEHESQVEFACEFHRWFDLIRTGRAISVIKSSSKNITITDSKLLLPIPFLVINQNPNVITQNEAYK